jgi:prepilin-type N-terminal cleavage/methylation domain-containing protein
MVMSNSKGFSLVEVMIVVTLIGLFATAASQLGAKWIQQTRLTEANGIVERAISQAKALAIRNPEQVFTNDATAALCVSDQTIKLKTVAAGAVNCTNAGAEIWAAKLPQGVTIKKTLGTLAATRSSPAATCVALFDRKNNYKTENTCANSAKLTIFTEDPDVYANYKFN